MSRSPESAPSPVVATAETVGNLAQDTLANVRIAMHGVGRFIAEKRRDHNGSTMEQMDHEMALHEHLGTIALEGGQVFVDNPSFDKRAPVGDANPKLVRKDTGVTHLGETPRERSVSDKVTGVRYQKHGKKIRDSQIDLALNELRYGKVSEGRNRKMGQESKRSINRRVRSVEKSARAEGVTRDEIRQRMAIERGKRVVLETPARVNALGRKEENERKLDRYSTKAVRRRSARQQRAIGRIKTRHQAASKHDKKIAKLRAEKAARRTS